MAMHCLVHKTSLLFVVHKTVHSKEPQTSLLPNLSTPTGPLIDPLTRLKVKLLFESPNGQISQKFSESPRTHLEHTRRKA